MFSKKARLVVMSLVSALTMCGSQDSTPASTPTTSPTGTPGDASPVQPLDAGDHQDGGNGDGGGEGGVSPGAVKFGVFARLSPGTPAFGMFSSKGVLDAAKTKNILDIGATWTRGSMSPFFTDQTIYGAGHYDWSAADIVIAWDRSNGIEPFIGIEAGPVQINDSPGTFAPHTVDRYPTASAFAAYCGAAAAHFSPVAHSYSIPGNEINTNPQQFPTVADAASYMSACYAAIKAADPSAFIYGLELNMDGQAGATAYVTSLLARGCGPGTCYDGISAHLSLALSHPRAGHPLLPHHR